MVQALDDLNLTIDAPGFIAIMGSSGSGKSTLLHLVAGLDQPDTGDIIVDEHQLCSMSQRQLTRFRRDHVGIVFQQFNLIPTLTAKQNIELPAVIARKPRLWITQRSEQLLADMALSDRASHRPDALSGGEQQRVAIARALLFSPRVLLADEPTGNLDSNASEKLWALLAQLAKSDAMTIIMVTHEPAAVVHCDKAFVMSDGRVVGNFDVNGMDLNHVASRYQQFVRSTTA